MAFTALLLPYLIKITILLLTKKPHPTVGRGMIPSALAWQSFQITPSSFSAEELLLEKFGGGDGKGRASAGSRFLE